jgi:hypothetical protein
MMIYVNNTSKKKNKINKKKQHEYEKWLDSHKVKPEVLKKLKERDSQWKYDFSVPKGRENQKISSHSTGLSYAKASEKKTYTGDKMLGIGTMHKSNAVPVFSREEAQEMSSMRR